MATAAGKTRQVHADKAPILEAVKNYRRVNRALLIQVRMDRMAHFSAFAEGCGVATRHAIILGWDFDRRARLFRDEDHEYLMVEVGSWIVKRRHRTN